MPDDNNPDQKAYYEAALKSRERINLSKERMRQRLAALSFSEKITILEKLRDRDRAIAAARMRREMSKDTH
jgi:hypothetical protein